MFLDENQSVKSLGGWSRARFRMRGLQMALAVCSSVVLLSACGGGDGYVQAVVPVNFNIGVAIGDQYAHTTPVTAGGSLDVVMHAGQHLRLDAGEPVVWTFFVGGSAITGGAQVYYAGADITAYILNASAVGIDTFAYAPLQAPIPVTLIATSTFDSVQVATINLLITN